MSNVITFNFNTKPIRTITRGGEPWFVAHDACRACEMNTESGTTQWLIGLGAEEKFTATRADHPGIFSGTTAGRLTLISESGLFKLIMRSNKPEARTFQDWVTKEVLPAIRKTGGYVLKGADRSLAQEGTVSQADVSAMLGQLATLIEALAPVQPAKCVPKYTARDLISMGLVPPQVEHVGMQLTIFCDREGYPMGKKDTVRTYPFEAAKRLWG